MPKADIATISPILLVTSLVMPALIGVKISQAPMTVFSYGYSIKLVTSLGLWFMAVSQTKPAYDDLGPDSLPGLSYFLPLIVLLLLNEIASTMIFNSNMSLFSKVADPGIGGSYMTLLNTLANLGSKVMFLFPKSITLIFATIINIFLFTFDYIQLVAKFFESLYIT